jgi:hypothetical protein
MLYQGKGSNMTTRHPDTAIDTIATAEQPGFRVRDWAVANAVGLSLIYALGALFAGLAESAGAAHESIARDLFGLTGFLIGALVFMLLRYRALAGRVSWSAPAALAAGIGLAAGFVVGFLIAGPPIDFLLGIVALGAIGGGLQWRRVRHDLPRPGRLLAVGIVGWIIAGIAAVAVAVALGDAINAALGGGTAPFVVVTGMIGLVGGAVGGSIEGSALAGQIASRKADQS